MGDDGDPGTVRFVELHGERIAYREAGSGEVLLLIHGMGGSSDTWGPVLSSLAKSYRVVAPDLLGHGLSAKPRTDYSLAAFAAGLRDLLDELSAHIAARLPRCPCCGEKLTRPTAKRAGPPRPHRSSRGNARRARRTERSGCSCPHSTPEPRSADHARGSRRTPDHGHGARVDSLLSTWRPHVCGGLVGEEELGPFWAKVCTMAAGGLG